MTGRRAAVVLLVLAGAATPLIAHAIGGSCWIYLPAHVPALLAGLALGPLPGLATGIATGVADLLWGGRVYGVAMLPLAAEFACYGLVAGLAAARARSYPQRLLALAVAMVAGRLVHLGVALPLGRDPSRLLRALFVTPWPGMVFQLVVLPALAPVVSAIGRAGATSRRRAPRP